MKTLIPLRVITLFIFVILLSGFVAYRSGAFDTLLNNPAPSLNSNINAEIPLDTPTTLTDSQPTNPVLLPTSKSGAIFIERDKTKNQNNNESHLDPTTQDSLKKLDSIKKEEEQKKLNQIKIMSSSKSLILFEPTYHYDLNLFVPKLDPFDIKKDTTELKMEAP